MRSNNLCVIKKTLFTALILYFLLIPILLLTHIVSGWTPSTPSKLEQQTQPIVTHTLSCISKNDSSCFMKNAAPMIDAKDFQKISTYYHTYIPELARPETQLIASDKSLVKGSAGKKYTLITVDTQLRSKDNTFLIMQIVYTQIKDDYSIQGISLNKIDQSLESINHVSLKTLTPIKITMLAVGIACIGIVITALLQLWKDSTVRKKWFWGIAIVITFPTFLYDLSGNHLYFILFKLILGGLDWHRYTELTPLLMGIGIPWGAIIFLIRHAIKRRRTAI